MYALKLIEEIKEVPGSLRLQRKRTGKPEIRHWQEEERKRIKENRNWILKRGYWKPGTPACFIPLSHKMKRSANQSLHQAVKKWNLANGK